MSGRTYRKRARAAAEAETRRRIVRAAVALHGDVGPARTTVSEIADRAGVSRPTVYKHFPDEAALLSACSSAYDAAHPPPDASAWTGIADPAERAATGLRELYDYFAANEPMLRNVLRDRAAVPALEALHRETTDPWLAAIVDGLARGWPVRGRRRAELRALLCVAVEFATWETLGRSGLGSCAAAGLMARLLAAAGR